MGEGWIGRFVTEVRVAGADEIAGLRMSLADDQFACSGRLR